jgi:hypothetical protein
LRAVSFAILAVASILLMAAPLDAASYTYDVASRDWSIASKWWGDAVPTAAGNAYIVSGSTVAIILPGAACNFLYLGGQYSANPDSIQMSDGPVSRGGHSFFLRRGFPVCVSTPGRLVRPQFERCFA